MTVVTVTRIYRFRAIHSLPDFPEPWCFPHQHDYTVEVEVAGDTPTDLVDGAWEALCIGVDGDDLNRVWSPSTVEHIAAELLKYFGPAAVSVTVWEDRARNGRARRV